MKNIIWVLLVATFISACSSVRTRERAKPAPEGAKQAIKTAKKDLDAGKKQAAMSRLYQVTQDYKGTDAEAEASLILGKNHYKQGEVQKALGAFLRAARLASSAEVSFDASQMVVRCYQDIKNPRAAIAFIDEEVKDKTLTNAQKYFLLQKKVQIFDALNEPQEALLARSELMGMAAEPSAHERVRADSLEIIETKLSQDELQVVASNPDFGFLRGYASFKLGIILMDRGSFSAAKTYFSNASELLPGTDLAERAALYADQLAAIDVVNSMTVGVVLPLTGRQEQISQRVLRGLQFGLGLGGSAPSPFRLALVDSEGNPDSARRAVERLVKEDNVIAIVGSLLSKTATSVAVQAQSFGVPSISLSQKSGVTEVGDYVFRNALTAEMQVRELVRVAMTEMGMRRFAILHSNENFGVEYANLFWDEVLARGGEIRGVQAYDPNETDFNEPIQRLVGTYFVEDREDEFLSLRRKWQESLQGRRTDRTEPPDDLLSPVIDFDAIFVPDSLRAIGQIAPTLTFNKVRGVALLGTNLWNNSGLPKRLENSANYAVFIDSRSPHADSAFVREFERIYQEKPGAFEVQGYETALIIKKIVLEGASSRNSFRERLTKMEAIQGASSRLWMNTSREVSKELMPFTVEKGSIVPLKTNPQ